MVRRSTALYFDNFGHGGDLEQTQPAPAHQQECLVRLRSVLFRRDENAWNYSLLANFSESDNTFIRTGPRRFGPLLCAKVA